MTKEQRRKILKHLKNKFLERGCKDFFFKSSVISKELDISSRSVGREVMVECRGGGRIKVIKGGRHCGNLYKTKFVGRFKEKSPEEQSQ